MNRKKIYEEVEDVLASFCQDCFLRKHFRKEKGRTYAHQFCISECTVGEKLKQEMNLVTDLKCPKIAFVMTQLHEGYGIIGNK